MTELSDEDIRELIAVLTNYKDMVDAWAPPPDYDEDRYYWAIRVLSERIIDV